MASDYIVESLLEELMLNKNLNKSNNNQSKDYTHNNKLNWLMNIEEMKVKTGLAKIFNDPADLDITIKEFPFGYAIFTSNKICLFFICLQSFFYIYFKKKLLKY